MFKNLESKCSYNNNNSTSKKIIIWGGGDGGGGRSNLVPRPSHVTLKTWRWPGDEAGGGGGGGGGGGRGSLNLGHKFFVHSH